MKLIREFNDFEWTKGLINPWELGYTAIEFDIQPSKEDVESLVNFALLMPNMDKDYKSIWERSMNGIIKKIINRSNSGGSKRGVYLILRNNKLLWGSRPPYSYEYNIIKYSHLINNNLNESDDFDWIREIPSSTPFRDIRRGVEYNIIIKQNFIDALKACSESQGHIKWMDLINSTKVISEGIMAYMNYDHVFCGHHNSDAVPALYLLFLDEFNKPIDHFWVTEDMIDLYPININLNESDEWDWVRGPINPWSEYDAIIFDMEPTRDEVNTYIEMALELPYVENKEAWKSGRDHDITNIINYYKAYGQAVLGLSGNDLSYGDDIDTFNLPAGDDVIRYSELKN
jgi:hypothetical protein